LPAPSTVLVLPPPSVALPGAAPVAAPVPPNPETPSSAPMAKPAAEVEAPAPVVAPGPAPSVKAVLKQVSVRGGSFQAHGFDTTLDTLYPQFTQCYATTLESKRRLKGDLVLGFTVKTSGRVVSAKSLGGSISDAKLIRCSLEVVQKTRFPKPRKQAAKIKLPLQYRLVSAVQ
jgi:TonB family protein